MIDWNRDGRIDPSEATFTAYLMTMEAEAEASDDEDFAADEADGDGRGWHRQAFGEGGSV